MKKFAFLSFIVLVLSSCVPEVLRPDPPRVDLLEFELTSVNILSGEARFRVRLRLENTNSYTLPLLQSTVSVYLNSSRNDLTIPAVTLDPGIPVIVDTELNVPVLNTVVSLGSLVLGQNVHVIAKGQLTAVIAKIEIPIGPFTLFEQDVRIQY